MFKQCHEKFSRKCNSCTVYHLEFPLFRERRREGKDNAASGTNETDEDDLQKVRTKMGHIDKEMPSRAGTLIHCQTRYFVMKFIEIVSVGRVQIILRSLKHLSNQTM